MINILSQNIRDEVNRLLQENDNSLRELKDTNTSDTVFPITMTKAIITSTGENLETLLEGSDLATTEQINELFYGAYDELNTLKEIGDAIKEGKTSEAEIINRLTTVNTELSNINTTISQFLTATQINDTFAKKTELNNLATKTEISGFANKSDLNSYALKSEIIKVSTLTQSAYDSLATKDPNTIYIING